MGTRRKPGCRLTAGHTKTELQSNELAHVPPTNTLFRSASSDTDLGMGGAREAKRNPSASLAPWLPQAKGVPVIRVEMSVSCEGLRAWTRDQATWLRPQVLTVCDPEQFA